MRAPKFQPNHDDSVHCVPCCVKMTLDYFLPDNELAISDVERITGFVPGKGAWEMEELLNYPKLGLAAKVVTDASYEEFAKRGFEYLEEVDGLEATQYARENTGDIELEKKRAAEVAKRNIHIYRKPNTRDIEEFLEKGWLVMLSVNARKLNSKPGFSGHRVLIYASSNEGVVMHDPGPPAHSSRKISWQSLESAWADPEEATKMLIAVGKLES